MEAATQAPPPEAPQSAPIARFEWDVDRYEQAVAAGIFTTEDPIELIDGEIITHMAPQYSPHATAVQLAGHVLQPLFGAGFHVRTQMPLRLGERSMPEPDVAVVSGAIRDYASAHPRTATLLLEVADSTLRLDRGRKLRLYAREKIPEYWIVNLPGNCVEVFRQPLDDDYSEKRTYKRGESIATGLNAAEVRVDDLLP